MTENHHCRFDIVELQGTELRRGQPAQTRTTTLQASSLSSRYLLVTCDRSPIDHFFTFIFINEDICMFFSSFLCVNLRDFVHIFV